MNRIDEQAAAWVAREDRSALDTQSRATRDAWLRADSRHLGAYARAHAAMVAMDRAGALGKQLDLRQFASQRQGWRRRFAALPTAAAAMLACLLVGFLAWNSTPDHYSTGLGEVLRVPLQDGSVVTLNSGSELAVDFNRDTRRVVLKRGEALFDVAKNKHRPFVVSAGDASITAVGTSFSVSRSKDRLLQVVVREGIVQVDKARLAPVRVVANSAVIAGPGPALDVEPLRADAIGRRLAWRDGMIAFDGDTLEQAAAQFARYSDIRILIDDPQVARQRVVGLYSATDPTGFARAVATSLGLRVESTSRGVYLRRDTRPIRSDDGGSSPPVHQVY